MSMHNYDFEVHAAFTAKDVHRILENNKDRLGFYLYDIMGVGDRVFLIFAFPKNLKGQQKEGSNPYDYAVGGASNQKELQNFINQHSSKIGFYIFKYTTIPEFQQIIMIVAFQSSKYLAEVQRAAEESRKPGKKVDKE